MKLFFDLFPVVLFFIAYKKYDIYIASGVIMVACVVQVGGYWAIKKKVEKVHLITLGAVLIFGGLTLALRNPLFIKWKPTIVNWILAAVFIGSRFIGGKLLAERFMGKNLEMPGPIWNRLNLAWVAFFILCGVLNLVVAYQCTENTWVNFKIFGLTSLSFAFIISQMFVLKNYIKPEEDAAVDPAE